VNEINSRALTGETLGFGAGNDEDVFVLGRVLNVVDFLMNVAFYTTAEGRIKLREIAKLHRIGDCRLAIADWRDVTKWKIRIAKSLVRAFRASVRLVNSEIGIRKSAII
jgi:hypothetical protein